MTAHNHNELYFGDCLEILKTFYNDNKEGFIDLVYIDPPFNSKRNYNILFEDFASDEKAQKEAFADTWSSISYKDTLRELKDINLNLCNFLSSLDNIGISKSAVSYLTTMSIRIYYIHKVLKDTGSFYLHCDPTMSHYLKLVCDLIFGEKNFRNEIIWSYKRYTAVSNRFQKLHDIILFYSKSEISTFNEIRDEYGEKSGVHDSHYKQDENGKWYRMQKRKGQEPYIIYLSEGRRIGDVWEIPIINASAKERLGYPTQKPEELLERIISASTNEGDLVADFFCGCGTSIAVAEKLKRKWIGVDISHLAIGLVERKRLIEPYVNSQNKPIYDIHGFPKDYPSAHALAQQKGGRFEFQHWVIEAKLGGVRNPKIVADGGWDGHMTFDVQGQKKTVIIEVKSGNVNVKNVREFIQVINKLRADIGVFVCFDEQITKPMLLAAKEEGYFMEDYFGTRYDKIQIISVENLIDNVTINIPSSSEGTFKKASKVVTKDGSDQQLF